MNLVFLGLLYDPAREQELLRQSRCGLQAAGNLYQWNLIDGLEENLGRPVDLLHFLPVGCWPVRYKKAILRGGQWRDSAQTLGCVNLPGLKGLTRTLNLWRTLRIYHKQHDRQMCILAYSLYTPFMIAAGLLKRRPGVTACLIVPDLLGKDSLQRPLFSPRGLLDRLNDRIRLRLLRHFDGFVLLTEKMRDALPLGNRPNVVVEGMVTPDKTAGPQDAPPDQKTILYTGTLRRQFGLELLLDAFSRLQGEEYRLWICGDGEMAPEMAAAARRDTRITYFGFLPGEETRLLQSRAALQVNPRPPEGAYTAYSFPSKTMEYLLSGRPVMMFRLDGVPREYDDCLLYFDRADPVAMAQRLAWAFSLGSETLAGIGRRGRDFVLGQKSGAAQARKVLKLLGHLHTPHQI